MKKQNENLSYVDSVTLNRIADKNSLDEYLRCKKEAKGELRFLMNPKLKGIVQSLVSELKPIEQQIIRMRYWEDLSVEDISKTLNSSEEKIQELLIATLAILKEKIVSGLNSKEPQDETNHSVVRGSL